MVEGDRHRRKAPNPYPQTTDKPTVNKHVTINLKLYFNGGLAKFVG